MPETPVHYIGKRDGRGPDITGAASELRAELDALEAGPSATSQPVDNPMRTVIATLPNGDELELSVGATMFLSAMAIVLGAAIDDGAPPWSSISAETTMGTYTWRLKP